MRIAIVYDCIYPHTVGGGERVYTELAKHLAQEHEVTYLTARQWRDGELHDYPFAVVAVSAGGSLYDDAGARRIVPTLTFGWGVFWHLLRHASRYDAVQSFSFPFFSVIGAKLALRLRRSRAPLIVDWLEIWTRRYWIEYAGSLAGRVGYVVQQLAMRLSDRIYTYSKLSAGRLAASVGESRVTRLTGLFEEPVHYEDAGRPPARPHVIFIGRHIPEKRVTALPAALAELLRRRPDATATIFGRGPESEEVRSELARLDIADRVEMPGFVDDERIRRATREASCLVLPSRREGYGLVVLEASSAGTPTVVVAGPDNAATELVEPGVNGFVAPDAEPATLAEAFEKAIGGGQELRDRTFAHYRSIAGGYALTTSLDAFLAAYRSLDERAATARS